MRKFNITVNGKTYEVEVDEVNGNNTSKASAYTPVSQVASEPSQASVSTPAEKPLPQKQVLEGCGGETILAPMPGNVIDIKVKEGDVVNKNDVVFILEAMKMQNEIRASKGGKVVQIAVTKGSSVNTGDLLIVLN
ncbi:biotin/lipoyl-containing protein [Clostridium sp. AWRP]|uniref:biotin/lipoyl-containing protein n=1 Tax=Clostridium sp. AWRP TaxID=2212991 RepID=UPI000FDCDC5D|nr:biotin/lipoyl-containing protein [Clostridium sp. AWRP]AZV55633.1 biotin/lipoyl-binding protein [Clostridium sp. AWRP]